MNGKNTIIRIISTVLSLVMVVITVSGCNLVKQTGNDSSANVSDVALANDSMCCPECSSTNISGPDADGKYSCNECGAIWAYNEEKEEIDVLDENGKVVDTLDISAGTVSGGSGSYSGGSYSGGGSSSGGNSSSGGGSSSGGNSSSDNTTTKADSKIQNALKNLTLLKDIQSMAKSITIVMDENGNYTAKNTTGKDTGLFGYKYSTTEKVFITAEDSWQRNFGFEETYDTAAGVGAMSYDTIRIFFEYDNKEWMIQYWKGQYGLAFVGAEIGIYTRAKGSQPGTYYNCANDDEKLVMSMDLYRRPISGSTTYSKLFSRNPFNTWWLTGFTPGSLILGTYVVPEDYTKLLKMDSKIVFDTPEEAQAFMAGVANVKTIYHNAPSTQRSVSFTELKEGEYDSRTDLSAKYALMGDGKTVRLCWR